ncbi:hypothetical protein E0Z10_g2038 [Xylaria hypoxylon]|uniref:Chromo domain-containing protein n=1 Tax=Xylaria hypoxylon TaxID=37992 RepID=A0A4Z0Z588_9PEZI|nr:hypothetical protein E0Z10_g2038 [Xylaria hypoxylon]
MAHAPVRTSRVEIPLPSKPRDYRPGDGPALAPVLLSLDHDTGAFIVDKRILPGKPINNELKLELYYIVGWPDLPAARVAILGTKILEYVSPRTLEDWEYKCLLENDEEEKRIEAQKRKQAERAKAHMASTPGTGTSTPGKPGQKKRGRPSKAEVLARRIAQQASFGDDELANVSLPPARTDGPSLSTPQKKPAQVAAYLEDLEEMEETDTNEAISKQLQGGSESDSDSPVTEGLDEPDKPATGTGFASLNSFLTGPSSRGYAEFLPNLSSPVQQDPTPSVPPVPIFLRPDSKKTPSIRKTQLTTPVPVPSYPKQPWRKKASVTVKKTTTPVPAPTYPLSGPNLPKQPHVVTITHVPVPLCPVPRPKSLKGPHKAKFSPIPAPVNSIPKPKVPHEVTFTPIPAPSYRHPPQESPKKPRKVTYTPVPPPFLQKVSETPTAGKKWLYSRRSQLQETADRAETEIEHNDRTHTPSKIATPTVKPSSSLKRKRPRLEEEQVEEEQEWEVKRLEDDKVLETSGELIRYFKVRWEGNWPAGQNPTWEPEENVSQVLVQKYLKDKAAKMAQSGSSPKAAIKRPTPILKKKYSSVAEAFQGNVDDLPVPSSSVPGDLPTEEEEEEEEDDDMEERFLVTEQTMTRTNTPSHRFWIDPALVRELAASFL